MRVFSKQQKGFTLVEIMVATSIFMMVMLAAIGGLMVASNSAKKSRALRSAMDNVNYAMENISRSLRLGSNYYCVTSGFGTPLPAPTTADCPGGGSAVAFTPAYHTLSDTAFQRVPKTGGGFSVQRCELSSCVDLTAPEVNISELRFFVRGSNVMPFPVDGVQPSVYIIMKGTVTANGEVTTFALQTLASQRNAE